MRKGQEQQLPALFLGKKTRKTCIMKRFHGKNDDIDLIRKIYFHEVMHYITEKYEKNSKNVQKSTCIFEWDVVI